MNYLLSDIARIVGGEHRGADLRVSEVATDSRAIVSGSDVVFAAINGKNHDGHTYIPRMTAQGVKAFIVEREVELPEGSGMVIVESTIVALQRDHQRKEPVRCRRGCWRYPRQEQTYG